MMDSRPTEPAPDPLNRVIVVSREVWDLLVNNGHASVADGHGMAMTVNVGKEVRDEMRRVGFSSQLTLDLSKEIQSQLVKLPRIDPDPINTQRFKKKHTRSPLAPRPFGGRYRR